MCPTKRLAVREGEGKAGAAAFVVRGQDAVLRIEPLGPEACAASAEDVAAAGREGEKDSSLFTIRLTRSAREWRSAVALSWAAARGTPAKVALEVAGDTWTFRVGSRAAALDWKSGTAR